VAQDENRGATRRSREAELEKRLAGELSTARRDGAGLTLILAESAASPGERLGVVSESSWHEIASRRLLVGDDWVCVLSGERKAFCLTHTGPASDPAIRMVFTRLGEKRPLAYGIAHYPGDAKTAQRLIEVAARRLEASMPVIASNR
jgi:hypothetical protein